MTNNTKQSEETFIQWRIAGNPVVSGESASQAILTIHPDGRVTTSPRLKPDKISALVLDQIKTHWMRDAQATKIRELQDRIKRLEDAGVELRECASWVGHSCCQYADQILRAKAAIEAWDKEENP